MTTMGLWVGGVDDGGGRRMRDISVDPKSRIGQATLDKAQHQIWSQFSLKVFGFFLAISTENNAIKDEVTVRNSSGVGK